MEIKMIKNEGGFARGRDKLFLMILAIATSIMYPSTPDQSNKIQFSSHREELRGVYSNGIFRILHGIDRYNTVLL